MMVMSPWICYLIAEGLELSGIVSICTNGVFLSYYAQNNISKDSARVLKLCYETVAVTAEQIVFLFLGIGLFAFNHPFDKMGWGLALTTVINLNFARFLNVMITTALVDCSRSKSKIPNKMKFVMWISGLRGAMAYALALKCASELELGPVILIDTLLYSFITILGVGSILNPILSKLGVKRKVEDETVEHEPSNSCATRLKRRIRNFDSRYFSPIFIK